MHGFFDYYFRSLTLFSTSTNYPVNDAIAIRFNVSRKGLSREEFATQILNGHVCNLELETSNLFVRLDSECLLSALYNWPHIEVRYIQW